MSPMGRFGRHLFGPKAISRSNQINSKKEPFAKELFHFIKLKLKATKKNIVPTIGKQMT